MRDDRSEAEDVWHEMKGIIISCHLKIAAKSLLICCKLQNRFIWKCFTPETQTYSDTFKQNMFLIVLKFGSCWLQLLHFGEDWTFASDDVAFWQYSTFGATASCYCKSLYGLGDIFSRGEKKKPRVSVCRLQGQTYTWVMTIYIVMTLQGFLLHKSHHAPRHMASEWKRKLICSAAPSTDSPPAATRNKWA